MDPLESRLRDCLESPVYKPVKFSQLAKKLGVERDDLEALSELLRQLIADGSARVSDSGRIESSRRSAGITGIVKRTASGDGYVTVSAGSVPKIVGEVVVFSEDMRDAQDRDEVLIRLTGKRRGDQRIAVVEKVVKRATTTFVGTYLESHSGGWVKIDGKQFPEPIALDDPEAGGVRHGDKVVVEMLRFPTPRRPGEAVLKQRLGAPHDVGVDTTSIIHEFALATDFPEEVLAQVREIADAFDDSDLKGREDLTGETIITIDPVDARDFDDAISLEKHKNGTWTLGVHIADVSHFVPDGTPLDREARARGNSVYLPGRVLPMLPEIISNGLASLQADRVRFTMTAYIDFDESGAVTGTRFCNSAIRVKHRFAYEQVSQLLSGPKKRPAELPKDVWDLVWRMSELARVLRQRRFDNGAINLELSAVKIDLDRDGRVTGAHLETSDESHQMIEEFMLAANIAVARKLAQAGLVFPRRVHPDPDPTRLQALQEFAKALGIKLPHLRSQRDMQTLLQKVHGTPSEYAVNFAMLRSMKQATYSTQAVGHFALAAPDYCHFTSPIRRYPDLVIHRQLKQVLTKKPKREGISSEALDSVCEVCSNTERRAADAERALTQSKLMLFLKDKVGLRMEAMITGVDRYGFFARGIELPAEGLIHVESLPGPERYEYDRTSQRLIGRKTGRTYQLGDRVMVEVARVDPGRRSLDFKLAPHSMQLSRKPGHGTEEKKGRRRLEAPSDRPSSGRGSRGRKKAAEPPAQAGRKKRRRI
jgi:ribonuclease R